MIVVILLVPTVLATWASWWITTVMRSASYRTSRAVSLICPVVSATILYLAAGDILGSTGTGIQLNSPLRTKELSALMLAVAIVLTGLSVLITVAAGKFSRLRAAKNSGQKQLH
jgi:hypothetical protein